MNEMFKYVKTEACLNVCEKTHDISLYIFKPKFYFSDLKHHEFGRKFNIYSEFFVILSIITNFIHKKFIY